MADRAEVIQGMEKLCKKGNIPFVCFDALELLKEQETVEHACEILRSNGWTETEPICSECDAIHVVRCKDCKYGHHIINTVNGEVRIYRVLCVKPYEQGSAVHEPDWFCADGKRK